MLGKILIVDDDQSTCNLLQRHLEARGFVVFTYTDSNSAFLRLAHDEFDLVLTDLNMAKLNGIELCDRIISNYPQIPVVVITAFGSLETAVEAIRVGAYDFITKPVDLDSLAHTVERAIKHSKLTDSVKRLALSGVDHGWVERDILGDSAAAVELRALIARSSQSNVPVLIIGESGSGKDLAASSIHRQGSRRNRPFVVFNCATVLEDTIETELFGSNGGHPGALLQANGGSLILKEVSQLPSNMQKKLERALAQGSIPDGSAVIPIDVRVISTTTVVPDLTGFENFRRDLFQRLSVIQISVPSLRQRENDVLTLAQHFVRQFSKQQGKEVGGIASGAAAKLIQYSWPGNVRELRNAIERGVALTAHERLVVEDLPEAVRRYRHTKLALNEQAEEQYLPIDEVERKHILKVLQSLGGNKLLAAKVLGLDRRTLYRKLERYSL
jgi:two-component system response regulator HydG